jgi:uncharacterized protein YegP (UPF0339 family)
MPMAEVTITRVVVKRSAAKFRFIAYGGNDRKVAWGQRYARKEDAIAAGASIAPKGVRVEDQT